MGVVRMPLSEVSVVCQLSNDISPEAPMHILVIGKKNQDDKDVCYLVTLTHALTSDGRSVPKISIKVVPSLSSMDFTGVHCNHSS